MFKILPIRYKRIIIFILFVCVCLSLYLSISQKGFGKVWIIAQGKNCGGNVRICCHIGGREGVLIDEHNCI
jgi:hypothetical protein